jgi:Leucine-rich repeat (LRR) protein
MEELKMSKMNMDSLPESIKELHYLYTFDISANNISSFDDDFFKKLTHLKHFNAEGNKIKNLPESFKQCRRIK